MFAFHTAHPPLPISTSLLVFLLIQITCHQRFQPKRDPPKTTHINTPLTKSTVQLLPTFRPQYGRSTIQCRSVRHRRGSCLRHHSSLDNINRLRQHTRHQRTGNTNPNILQGSQHHHGRRRTGTTSLRWIIPLSHSLPFLVLYNLTLQYIPTRKGGNHKRHIPRHGRLPRAVKSSESLRFPNHAHRLPKTTVDAGDQPLFDHLLGDAHQTAPRGTRRGRYQRSVLWIHQAEYTELKCTREQCEGGCLGTSPEEGFGADVG
mmetsp:Transcript_37947/g.79480  ORF Transcript_37947/g.79480 Transcript_37947/m.79480 type:complete len:260 (-) Transcript_37947:439-1218(-)